MQAQMEIGPTLREARIRGKVDLTEVEQKTKIRARYLRALENEEWHVLPEGAYIRSFIRTYATYLGLDGERLADEYRRRHEDELAARYPHVEPLRAGGGAGEERFRPRLGGGALVVLISIALVGLLIVLGVTGGADNDEASPGRDSGRGAKGGAAGEGQKEQTVSLRLAATGEVWVCLLDGRGDPVLNGEILSAGDEEGPFRSPRFTMALGNGQLTLDVGGREVRPQPPGSPTGYLLRPPRSVQELEEGERPDCA